MRVQTYAERPKLAVRLIKGIECLYRKGYSDLKTFEEVIERNGYQTRGSRIIAGEHWMDCGANVGAFTLLACSLGAKVTAYEPDPSNCEMIERNLTRNGFKADIVPAALVHDEQRKAVLHFGNNNNVWRNSIVKQWNKVSMAVACRNFDEEANGFDCCKMDIEGSEMAIIEATSVSFSKFIFEWSFDIDPSLPRFWHSMEKLKTMYGKVLFSDKRTHFTKRDYLQWQPSWIPPCEVVHCAKESE